MKGQIDLKSGKKHRGDLKIKDTENGYDRISKIAAMAAILKSIFHFFSWTEMLIDLKLGRKHRGDL